MAKSYPPGKLFQHNATIQGAKQNLLVDIYIYIYIYILPYMYMQSRKMNCANFHIPILLMFTPRKV